MNKWCQISFKDLRQTRSVTFETTESVNDTGIYLAIGTGLDLSNSLRVKKATVR